MLSFLRQIPLTFALPMAMICGATLFGFGYFSSIGMEFLSMASVTDWLFFAGITAIPFLASLGLLEMILRAIRKGEPSSDEKKVPIWFALLIAAVFVAAVIYRVHGFWRGINLCAVVFLPVLFGERIYGAIQRDEWPKASELIIFLVTLAVAPYSLGQAFGELTEGRSCKVSFKSGQTASMPYLRTLGDGHVFRLNGRVYFVSKDELTQMDCVVPDRTW